MMLYPWISIVNRKMRRRKSQIAQFDGLVTLGAIMDNRSKPPESAPANRPRETEAVHCAGEYWGGFWWYIAWFADERTRTRHRC
jgi:hypothetical protein